MAIGTPNFAFVYFGLYSFPGVALTEQQGNITQLLPLYMIKFKDAHISLTAIDTGVRREVSI
jgi:hypothetical protein